MRRIAARQAASKPAPPPAPAAAAPAPAAGGAAAAEGDKANLTKVRDQQASSHRAAAATGTLVALSRQQLQVTRCSPRLSARAAGARRPNAPGPAQRAEVDWQAQGLVLAARFGLVWTEVWSGKRATY